MAEYTPSTTPRPARESTDTTRVYLTGFMGAGKSTVGPLLADRLGYRFIDLDEQIEARAEQPVASLFDTGEDAFRALESTLLRELSDEEDVVIAPGGGALASETNLSLAQRQGVIVYLKVSVDELTRRLADDAADRPLLYNRDGTPLRDEALRERIATLLAERELRYKQADIIVNAEQAPEEVADAVMEQLKA